MSTLADAFAPHEVMHREAVLRETWGHLAPKRNKTYRGIVTFALGCFGSDDLNPTVLGYEFDLDGSPWFYDSIIEYLQSLGGDAGCVYEVDATFRNYRWTGKSKLVLKAKDRTSKATA